MAKLSHWLKLIDETTYNHHCYCCQGDEPAPSGSIEGHGLRGGRSGDPGGRGDPDDYYYEV